MSYPMPAARLNGNSPRLGRCPPQLANFIVHRTMPDIVYLRPDQLGDAGVHYLAALGYEWDPQLGFFKKIKKAFKKIGRKIVKSPITSIVFPPAIPIQYATSKKYRKKFNKFAKKAAPYAGIAAAAVFAPKIAAVLGPKLMSAFGGSAATPGADSQQYEMPIGPRLPGTQYDTPIGPAMPRPVSSSGFFTRWFSGLSHTVQEALAAKLSPGDIQVIEQRQTIPAWVQNFLRQAQTQPQIWAPPPTHTTFPPPEPGMWGLTDEAQKAKEAEGQTQTSQALMWGGGALLAAKLLL